MVVGIFVSLLLRHYLLCSVQTGIFFSPFYSSDDDENLHALIRSKPSLARPMAPAAADETCVRHRYVLLQLLAGSMAIMVTQARN